MSVQSSLPAGNQKLSNSMVKANSKAGLPPLVLNSSILSKSREIRKKKRLAVKSRMDSKWLRKKTANGEADPEFKSYLDEKNYKLSEDKLI